MAVTIVRPSGRRADDVRALRLRYRLLQFTGNYPPSGGEIVTAASVGLKRILGIIPLDTMTRAPNGTTGTLPIFDVSTDGRTVAIRQIEDAAGAANSPFGADKNGSEAYIASSQLAVIFVGE